MTSDMVGGRDPRLAAIDRHVDLIFSPLDGDDILLDEQKNKMAKESRGRIARSFHVVINSNQLFFLLLYLLIFWNPLLICRCSFFLFYSFGPPYHTDINWVVRSSRNAALNVHQLAPQRIPYDSSVLLLFIPWSWVDHFVNKILAYRARPSSTNHRQLSWSNKD